MSFENEKDVVVHQFNGGSQLLTRDISIHPLVLEVNMAEGIIMLATESQVGIDSPTFVKEIDFGDDSPDAFFEKDGLFEDMTFVGTDDLRFDCQAAYGNTSRREYRYRIGTIRLKLQKIANKLKITAHMAGDAVRPHEGFHVVCRHIF